MSTVKISALPAITQLNANTANTLIVGVDIPTGITGKITTTTLAQGLYSHNALNVGERPIVLPNTAAQFISTAPNYVQVNLQNQNNDGTADYVVTANTGTDTSFYIDMGYANENYDNSSPDNSLGTALNPLDGYLYVQGNDLVGGNLVIGTTSFGTRINFIAGGIDSENVIGYIDSTGAKFTSIDDEISSNVALLDSYLTNNVATLNYSVTSNVITLNTSISTNVATLNNSVSSNVATINSSIDANLAISKAYTDSVNSNNTIYTNSSISANLATAKAYTDTANTFLQNLMATEVSANLATAKAYTDSANTYIVNLLESEVSSNLATAKAYTDTANTYVVGLLQSELSANLATAKAYTDTANTFLQNQINTINGVNTSQNAYSQAAYSHANSAYTQANNGSSFANSAYTLANTNASAISTANTFLQANDATTLAAAKSYTDTANTNLKLYTDAQVSANLATAKAYTDTANSYIQSHYLANTSGTFDGNLIIAGQANVNSNMVVANGAYDYTNTALVRIVGSTGAFYTPPSNPGYMLAITGVDGVASRVINTGHGTGAYGLFAARSSRGTAQTPTALQSGDVIARFSGGGYNGTTFTSTGQGRIDIVADENFTVANTGSRIEFYNTTPQTNTVTKIATFNALSATFTGVVNPQKGFIYTPNVINSTISTLNLDIANNSMIKCNTATTLSVSLSGFQTGKVVEVWITNISGSTQTVTHGCSAINSTINNTTFSMPATSSAYLRYFSIDGDLANTFVTVNHA